MSDVNSRELKASLLSFYMIAVTRGLHYLTSLLLLFLLTPFDFGVMAVVMAVMAIMNSLSVFGFESALISFQGDEGSLLNDAWSLEVLKGVFLAIIVILLAPYIAIGLEQPILKNLLSVMSIAFILQSSKNKKLVSLRKRLDFIIIFKCEIGMATASSILTVAAAYYFASPWAIVLGYLGGWMMYVFLSYLLCSYRPKLSFDRTNIRGLVNYSKWILLSGQINTLVEHGINLLIGSHFGIAVLGQFERANMFTRQTALQIGEVLWKVGLPSLSARSSDVKMLRDQYLLMYSYICLLICPLMMLVNIYIPVMADLADSRDWEQFNKLIVVLGITAVVTMLLTPASILFQSLRKPSIGFNVAIVRLVSILVFIIPCIQLFGVIGVAYTLALGACIALPYTFYSVRKLVGVSFSKHMCIFLKYLAPCLIFTILSPGEASFLWDIIMFMLMLTVYLALIYFSSKEFRLAVVYLYRSFNGS